MTFVQLEFVVLLAIVLVATWAVPRRRFQNAVLLVSSCVFYGWVHPWLLSLLAFSTLLDFGAGLGMHRWPRLKKRFLMLSLAGNLGLLGVFKYLDFFIENVAGAMSLLGVQTSMHTLGIFLPAGISFFTFQTMSYSIDIYRGKVQPRRNLLDYATFVTMFPQLVAGPVERARHLLPQLEMDRRWDPHRFRSGVSLALWGAVKKVMVADTMADHVDPIFTMSDPSAGLVCAATVGFAVQILADFSGYTDIARGTARMLGIELMENFRHPYLATSPSEFWKRWHISFSSWIHEYLYIPLGGSRFGEARRTAATFGALLLSGLWHGASWNFVLWGAFHASLLTAYRHVVPRIPRGIRDASWSRVPAVGLMFAFTCVGWLLFRERDLGRLADVLGLIGQPASEPHQILTTAMWTMVALGGGVLVLALLAERHLLPRLRAQVAWPVAQAVLWTGACILLFIFARESVGEFIYFQF